MPWARKNSPCFEWISNIYVRALPLLQTALSGGHSIMLRLYLVLFLSSWGGSSTWEGGSLGFRFSGLTWKTIQPGRHSPACIQMVHYLESSIHSFCRFIGNDYCFRTCCSRSFVSTLCIYGPQLLMKDTDIKVETVLIQCILHTLVSIKWR